MQRSIGALRVENAADGSHSGSSARGPVRPLRLPSALASPPSCAASSFMRCTTLLASCGQRALTSWTSPSCLASNEVLQMGPTLTLTLGPTLPVTCTKPMIRHNRSVLLLVASAASRDREAVQQVESIRAAVPRLAFEEDNHKNRLERNACRKQTCLERQRAALDCTLGGGGGGCPPSGHQPADARQMRGGRPGLLLREQASLAAPLLLAGGSPGSCSCSRSSGPAATDASDEAAAALVCALPTPTARPPGSSSEAVPKLKSSG